MEFKTEKNFGNYWVKGIKNFKGHEGEPLFQCSVYKNGKRIGFFSEDSWGGSAQLQSFSAEDEKTLRSFANEFEGEEARSESYHSFIAKITTEIDIQRHFKRLCKTKTLFTTKGMDYGSYRTIKALYKGNEKQITDYLDKKYSDGYIIINTLI